MKPDMLIHKMPLVYCTGKPAPYCAVFATPPAWNRRADMPYEPYAMVQDKSASGCAVGKWYSIAYKTTKVGGYPVVVGEVVIGKPKRKKGTR